MHALAQTDREVQLPQFPLEPDLFGRVLLDCFEGRSTEYYLRRDDNLLERDSTTQYFRTWEQLPAHQRCLLKHARGRVLDLGAGAGQHALALQRHGLDVVAIDSSPLAIEICRQQGVQDARVMDANALDLPEASFDSVMLMSGNLGLAGTPSGLRQLLGALHRLVRPGGQLLADVTDYTAMRDASHRRYQRHNLTTGRHPGQLCLRVEYDGCTGPQFNWLRTSLPELRAFCAETGWRVDRVVQVNDQGTYAVGIYRM